ncbi:iron uptake transporter deferrochelatase/peroxidase subunit [Nocardioides terrisoli]|uniref:iron uptake transporter deferrochelatase/peroxidase subunit n=1 Tax=Nocardioides terrisoli TaxID=3388267 RepID=UPI00287B9F13|nr:iron uptake transporter deferrochelatase/peroxidase subunit [Nocardioides marmorisolisilvae]
MDGSGTSDISAHPSPRGAGRRAFLGGALGAAGLAVGGATGFGIGRDSQPSRAASATLPFYGRHQAGISTATQDRLAFAAFDVTTGDRMELARMLGTWAAAAERLTRGEQIGPVETHPQAPPVDTGEAVGLSASRLTVTVGFGPSLFDDRFGLADRRPAVLSDLPALPGDSLRREISGGDLAVQACADDPQVAFHVIRNFARLARGTAVMRWSQLGFGKTASTSSAQATPRNLMGFKDGTRNIKEQDHHDFERFVWVGDETDQDWMRGGSYLVTRRIRMLIESWDTDFLADQENVFGRVKDTGAPLTGTHEFDTPDLSARDGHGNPVIPLNAHIRLAAHETNGGTRLLRRGYSYTDGIDPVTGYLDAGLFFITFQKDPDQFVRIQRKLGSRDLLNEYIQHTSSAVFACPPGLSGPGDWWGRTLFAET